MNSNPASQRSLLGRMSDTSATSTTIPSSLWRIITKFTVSTHNISFTRLLNLFRFYHLSHGMASNYSNVVGRGQRYSMSRFTDDYFSLDSSEFLADNPKALHPRHARSFVSDNSGRDYNLCHCTWIPRAIFPRLMEPVWSNFEIADMDFCRGEVYTNFYEFLESKGGFYYEVSLGFCAIYLHPPLTQHRDGEMHLSIALQSRSLLPRNSCTFSTILDIDTKVSSIAPWEKTGIMAAVPATL